MDCLVCITRGKLALRNGNKIQHFSKSEIKKKKKKHARANKADITPIVQTLKISQRITTKVMLTNILFDNFYLTILTNKILDKYLAFLQSVKYRLQQCY